MTGPVSRVQCAKAIDYIKKYLGAPTGPAVMCSHRLARDDGGVALHAASRCGTIKMPAESERAYHTETLETRARSRAGECDLPSSLAVWKKREMQVWMWRSYVQTTTNSGDRMLNLKPRHLSRAPLCRPLLPPSKFQVASLTQQLKELQTEQEEQDA